MPYIRLEENNFSPKLNYLKITNGSDLFECEYTIKSIEDFELIENKLKFQSIVLSTQSANWIIARSTLEWISSKWH